MPLNVREYQTADGESPFRRWLGTLDRSVRARIQARVLRFEASQRKDIRRAQDYWRDYLQRT